MTDLDKLIDKVESGDITKWGDFMPHLGDGNLPDNRVELACQSYKGSLDAAKALHEALLPGWVGYADTTGFCFLYEDENEANESSSLCIGNPARAWLLSILKAYRAQKENNQ